MTQFRRPVSGKETDLKVGECGKQVSACTQQLDLQQWQETHAILALVKWQQDIQMDSARPAPGAGEHQWLA